MLIKKTCPNFGVKEHSQKSFRNQTSVNNEEYHEVSGVANLRENLALSGILETTSHLMARARWETSIKLWISLAKVGWLIYSNTDSGTFR